MSRSEIMLVREKIRILRKKKGLKASELGELLGVNQATISRYENGYVRVIPKDKLSKMCNVFNCDMMDIINDDPAYFQLYKKDIKTENDFQMISQEDKDLLEWFHNLSHEQKTIFHNCISQNTDKQKYTFIMCGAVPFST